MNFWRRFVILVFIAVLLASPAAAGQLLRTADGNREVVVGYIEDPGFFSKGQDGSYQGYEVEYLYEIAQRLGLKITFRDMASVKDCMAALQSGSIDMTMGFIKTPERERLLLFSEKGIGSASCSVLMREGDDRFDYDEVAALGKLRIARLMNNAGNIIFDRFCANYGIKPQLTEYRSYEEVYASVADGRNDAIFSGSGARNGYHSIMNIEAKDFYFVFSRKRRDLKAAFDGAMNALHVQDPLYDSKLYDKCFDKGPLEASVFSKREKAYIAASKVIKVALVKNDTPFSRAGRDGSLSGALPDYFARLSESTGLKFSFVPCDSLVQTLAMVSDGKADATGMCQREIVDTYRQGLAVTRAYARYGYVRITRAGSAAPRVYGIIRSCAVYVAKQMATVEPQARLQVFSNLDGAFGALNNGTVDAIICKLPKSVWLMNQHRSSDYAVVPMPLRAWEACIAVRQDNPLLRSILDKAIATSGNSYEGILSTNTLPDDSLRSVADRIPVTILLGGALAAAAAAVLLLFTIVVLVRRQHEKTALAAARATAERRQTQLEALEKGVEEKNQFFSNISHDMRTPLNAIIGFADIARAKDASPEVKDCLAKIKLSGSLLLELINDTLTLSKANSGKLKLKLEPVADAELFESITTPIRAAAEAKGVSFTADFSRARNRTVMADRLNLQKIFLNLLSNAVKYTPAGGHVHMLLRNEPEDSPSPDSLLVISDDGIGISEEYLPHIYEPFSQEQRHGTGPTGTGLGLSIVKRLVDLMGGTIDVKSVRDQGTTFTVRLHFAEADEAAAAENTGNSSDVDLSGKKILVCEDNELNQEIARTLLEAKGASAAIAANGREGLEAFANSEPGEYAAVLMDIRMPVMDGYEAAQAIRALDRPDAKSVPIVAMTADAFADDVRKCLESGMNAHVAKPIAPEKLYAAIANLTRQ